jgi:hypothetical protein
MWPLLWSSGQGSCLQIQSSGFDSRHYHILWEVVSLARGPLSLVSAVVELPGRKSSGSGLEIREYGRRDPSRWPRGNLYPQKLAPSSPTSGGPSVGRVRSRTRATEFMCYVFRVQKETLSRAAARREHRTITAATSGSSHDIFLEILCFEAVGKHSHNSSPDILRNTGGEQTPKDWSLSVSDQYSTPFAS